MSSLAYLIAESQDRLRSHPHERAGQAAFNVLAEFDAALAVEIAGTDADPFHDNDNLRAFWLKLADALADEGG